MSTKRYFKLGKTASSYTHPSGKLNIRGGEVVSIDANIIAPGDKSISTAVTHGHIVELEKSDIKDHDAVVELPLKVPEPKPRKISPEIINQLEEDDLLDDEDLDDEEDDEDEDEKAPVKKSAPAKEKSSGNKKGGKKK